MNFKGEIFDNTSPFLWIILLYFLYFLFRY